MNKRLIVTLLLQLSFSFIYSQTKITKKLAREINEQIFDTDNFYPKTSVETNKRFEVLNGKIEKEIITYSDSIQVINSYNINGSLVLSKVLKKGVLRSTYRYEYKPDGKTLQKERGIYNLDYTVYKKDKYSTKYYAVKATGKEQGSSYKYLDTLFINKTKYSYEFIKQINSKYTPIDRYRYKFKYNHLGYLKQIQIFENDIKVGHFINTYNKNNQVINHELFWDYEYFYYDTGFSSVRNHIYDIEYNENGIIKLIRKQNYNPTTHEWEKSITNYNSVISKEGNLLKAHFFNDSGVNMKIEIDSMGNWVYKSESVGNTEEITKRTLKYFQ